MVDYSGVTNEVQKLIDNSLATAKVESDRRYNQLKATHEAYVAAHPDAGEAPDPIEPEPKPDPEPEPVVTSGIYLSPEEVARIQTNGPEWTAVNNAANGSWGSVALNDNNSNHDVYVLAGAIVAARTGNAAMRAKVAAALDQVANATTFARVLEMSRQIPAYVFAADLIGYQSTKFDSFLTSLLTKSLTGHSGGNNLLETAMYSANNWGTMARAAAAAIAVRTNNESALEKVALAHRGFLGEAVPHKLSFGNTAWHANNPKSGINRRGSTKDGRNFDGVIPEDQRRSESGDGYTWGLKGSYPWECLQGAITTGVILHRAGIVPFNAGDDALVRAAKWLTYVNNNPAVGDDTWLPWLLNYYGKAGLPTHLSGHGKNGGWTGATHPA